MFRYIYWVTHKPKFYWEPGARKGSAAGPGSLLLPPHVPVDLMILEASKADRDTHGPSGKSSTDESQQRHWGLRSKTVTSFETVILLLKSTSGFLGPDSYWMPQDTMWVSNFSLLLLAEWYLSWQIIKNRSLIKWKLFKWDQSQFRGTGNLQENAVHIPKLPSLTVLYNELCLSEIPMLKP